MCLIVDANVAARVFAVPYNDDFRPIWEWIENRGGKIVYGGQNKVELERIVVVRKRLFGLWKAGRAIPVPAERVSAEQRPVNASGRCRSDDPHVIALARASGARVLCTEDGNLEKDFKDLQLVPRPRGAIYKRKSHRRLLKHNAICEGRPR
jgi:hypothetical protein